MIAAIITQKNAPLELWDLDFPFRPDQKHCGPSQVLVDIRVSGICGAQLKEIAGERDNEQWMPHLCGHEAAAVIRDVGQGVNTQMIGKKCVLHWRKGTGGESIFPAQYDVPSSNTRVRPGTTVGGGHVTTLCEQAIVSVNRVTVVPPDVPDELCALLGCGLSTALGTIEQEARLKFGESVLIVGCGGVGLNLIQAAKLACAYPIVGADISDEKSHTVLKLGAHMFWNTHNPPPEKKFDVIVDTTGSLEALETTIPMMTDGGRYVCLGQTKSKEHLRVMGAVNMFFGDQGRRIIWSQGGGFQPSLMIPRYVNLWRAGLLDLESIISHRFPLVDVNRGIDLVRAGQAGRVLVQMR